MARSKRSKIALLGAGQIGGTLALLCGLRNLGEVVLYDIVEGMPQGKALDLSHLAPILGLDFPIKGTNSLSDIEGADVCVVTSGLPRKPGMSRDDLVKTNADIIKDVGAGIRRYAPDALVIVITNPLDAMASLMQSVTEFSPSKVVGMAGVLDSGRYEAFLAEELNVSVNSVFAFVLGGHGDDMVPVRSYTSNGGIPISTFIKSERLDQIEKRVRGAGGEVVNLLKTGSAFYSPAASAVVMIEAYLFDQKKVLAASAHLNGEYGEKGIYLGVPVVIGAGGVEKIVEIELNSSEKEALARSAQGVKELIALAQV
jgi:malate dehydrogenase